MIIKSETRDAFYYKLLTESHNGLKTDHISEAMNTKPRP